MATTVRNIDSLKSDALVTAKNAGRLDMLKLQLGTIFHADASATIATPDASSLGTSITLANALKVAYNAHVVSVCSATTGQGAHIASDVAHVTAVANASDLTTVEALLNDIKAKFNLHAVASGIHASNDTTIATTDASDQGTANTLANAIKAKLNSHFAAALASPAIALVDP